MCEEAPIEFLLHLRALDDDQPDLTKFNDEDFIRDPTAVFIEKAQFDRAMGKAAGDEWDEQLGGPLEKSASEVPHKDGVEVEKCGAQIWRYTYAGGTITGIELEDPELPGGRMSFDAEGNEIAA